MSTSHNPHRFDPVLRGPLAAHATPARFAADLRFRLPTQADPAAIQSVQEQARAAGYAEGWAQGQRAAAAAARAEAERAAEARKRAEAEAEMKLARALEALARAAAQLEARTAPTISMMEELIIAAALELTEALLGRELATVDTRARDALRRALSLTPPAEPVVVRLHPEDYHTLLRDDWTNEFHVDGRTVQLQPDPSLSPGDAIAEAGATTVDATLPAALARVKEVLAQ
ncbi:MAG TPA: FliH/SctL family protein [Micromonospora sp.]|nr:MAG: flagellar assembly protein [Actinomycetota bacterium]